MAFKDSVWDDSDPTYAPCINRVRKTFHWKAPKKYVTAGYQIRTLRLEGEAGDGKDMARAAHCRALTRDMLEWYEGCVVGREPGTWGWLISRYLTDEFSGIHEVRPQTREQYKKQLAKIEQAIGAVLIAETDYTRIMSWKRAMENKGRSSAFIKRWFTHFRLVLSHGVMIEAPRCAEIRGIMSSVRIKNPPRRQHYLTREQVMAVVDDLDANGFGYAALATLIRFEFMLRGVDVQGQWAPIDGREGGITHNGRMWEGGLTWEMFDAGLTSFEKVISKTQDSMPEPYTFDLTAVPHIRERLLAVPLEKRVGPLIVLGDGTIPKGGAISRRFKYALRNCELPDHLQIRDTRSGGVTEAKSLVDPYALRDAAQHTQITTTDIYTRGRSESANKVVQMRQRGTK